MDKTARPSARSNRCPKPISGWPAGVNILAILDSRSKVGNFKCAPVGEDLFLNPRFRVRNEDEKCDGS